jgi:hypothetical protein
MVFCCWVAATVANGRQQTVDLIVALVNGDVITRSDLLWNVALDPASPSPAGRVSTDVLRQTLEVVIDQRLVLQEASRLPSDEVTQKEIEDYKAALIKRFSSPQMAGAAESVFSQRIQSVGLTSDRLNELIAQRILIERFVEFRFKSFVFVSEQEVQKYYDERLVPEMRSRGVVPPPLKDVRDQIVPILRREKVNDEIDRWLPDARRRAEIVIVAEP